MRLLLFFLLFTAFPVSAFTQTPDVEASATTEDGREVLLYEDGTWEYAQELTERAEAEYTGVTFPATTDLVIGDKTMKAGLPDEVTDDVDMQIAARDKNPHLVMWKEITAPCEGGLRSLEERFGDVSLFLRGGEKIHLATRRDTGRRVVTEDRDGDGENSSYCQTWGIYPLSRDDIRKLKGSPLSKIRIRWTQIGETQLIHLSRNKQGLKKQIEALGL